MVFIQCWCTLKSESFYIVLEKEDETILEQIDSDTITPPETANRTANEGIGRPVNSRRHDCAMSQGTCEFPSRWQ